eukprot:Seg6347.2 transcript_id=Seg6347.2/GoldUCD/mRNA.D3Y31 product="hypothetical protein" protein_id=Seg6347.2/GoldUCD/D3Y31
MLRRKLPCGECFGYGKNLYADPRCQFGCRGGVSRRGSGSGSGAFGRGLGSGSGAFGRSRGSGFGALRRGLGSGFGAFGRLRGSRSGAFGRSRGSGFGTFGRNRSLVSGANRSNIISSSTSTKSPLIPNYSFTSRIVRAKRALNTREKNGSNVSALNIGSTPHPSQMASPKAKYDQSNADVFDDELRRVMLFSVAVILLVMMLLLILRRREGHFQALQSMSISIKSVS